MKRILFLIGAVVFSVCALFARENKAVVVLVQQGIDLHEHKHYDEAIANYKTALAIDKHSALANYELAYTYFTIQQYDKSLKYSKQVIKKHADNDAQSYVILGNIYDLKGEREKAIKTYKKGLESFPRHHLLSYNLALAYYGIKDYKNAEIYAIRAVETNPQHANSHIILSAIMKEKGERIKTLLPLYYVLMLEPNEDRSRYYFNYLMDEITNRAERVGGSKVVFDIPNITTSSDFGIAETVLSVLCATRYTKDNESKSDFDFFIRVNKSLFGTLGELRENNSGFWWDFYAGTLSDVVKSNQCETYCYYISQAEGSRKTERWMISNADLVDEFEHWLRKNEIQK